MLWLAAGTTYRSPGSCGIYLGAIHGQSDAWLRRQLEHSVTERLNRHRCSFDAIGQRKTPWKRTRGWAYVEGPQHEDETDGHVEEFN